MTSIREFIGTNVNEDHIIVRSDVLHHLVDSVGHLYADKVDTVQPGDGLVELRLVDGPASADDEALH